MSKLSLVLVVVAGCASTPRYPDPQHGIEQQGAAALGEMRATDPGLEAVLRGSYAYAVFPDVGRESRGVLYERGKPTGLVELKRGMTGERFAELVVLGDPGDVARLKAGTFGVGVDTAAVIVRPGAAAFTTFHDGMAVFVVPHGKVTGSIAGQQIDFHPLV